ncbi:MAG: 2-phospho-L-lactate guanylyltransferase [Deltaproteobacteria bacterium]|nr:2-phospho-L-lactate guanylyltransferase [Deltaproteobacteria bacterium]
MKFALVPVKALAWGKSRLSALLSEEARQAVSRAMLIDVLNSLRHSSMVEKFAVVSSDATLLALAQEFGAYVVDEGQPRGLSGAVTIGTDFCLQKGATALLVLLADLPLVEPEDIDSLFHQGEEIGRGVILATCKEREGTNALLRVPPLVIPPCFGGPSLEAHRQAARQRGVPFRAVEAPHIAFDIDSVEDLQQLIAHPSQTQTYRVLQEIGVLQKPLVR